MGPSKITIWPALLIVLMTYSSFSINLVDGFYVPGVAPQDFASGDSIEVRAIKMTSSKTQLPFEYYSLPFCQPKSGSVEYKSQNLGEIPQVCLRPTGRAVAAPVTWPRSLSSRSSRGSADPLA